MTTEHNTPRTKAEWRRHLGSQRRATSTETREFEARAIAKAVVTLPMIRAGSTVCCYVPFGPEPGSTDMLEALAQAGAHVLLPIVPTEPGPLDWARYDGPRSLADGPLPGLREPAGQRLGPHAIEEAHVVLIPAVAVDHAGVRLGRGAGYYDRSLPLASRDAHFVAIVRDNELVPRLPAEPHDMRMSAALTPGAGLITLPR